MIPLGFLYSIQILTLFLFSLVIHELGHIIYFRIGLHKKVMPRFIRHGRATVIQIGTAKDYEGLTKEQGTKLYLSGILAGFLVIFAGILYTNNILLMLILVPYFIACHNDVKNSGLFSLEDK